MSPLNKNHHHSRAKYHVVRAWKLLINDPITSTHDQHEDQHYSHHGVLDCSGLFWSVRPSIDSRERNRDRKPQVFTRSLRTPADYRVFKRIQKFGI